MSSIALLIFVSAILYVIFWSLKNDDVASIEDQKGFIAMKKPETMKKPEEKSVEPSPEPGLEPRRRI